MRRKLKILIPIAGALAALATLGSFAGAADPSLKTKIDSAQGEAHAITQRINTQSARIEHLEQRATEATARERELTAQLETSTARSTELATRLTATEQELTEVRARYKRAVAVLSERLVEIYKSSDPDFLSVLLDSDGFDDLQTRVEYLDALTDADKAIAERVKALHDQVNAHYEEIADLKADIDAETRRLDSARAEIADIRASAEKEAASLADARAAQRSALAELQDKIMGWELEVRRQAAQELGDNAFLGGPYAIPTYIVICESGGNYRALNPSSGAGGAYQILPSTWRAYGGTGLPPPASKREQDRIAALIWKNDGPGAWSCA